MGNCARIFLDAVPGVAVYLHWNGGPESVYPFVAYAKAAGVRLSDPHGIARLCQIIGNFFGGTLSLGVEAIDQTEPNWESLWVEDNGLYFFDAQGECTRRVVSTWNGCRDLTDAERATERADAARHRYATDTPSIADTIADKNGQFFNQDRPATEPPPVAVLTPDGPATLAQGDA
jgi:hypothetical protein